MQKTTFSNRKRKNAKENREIFYLQLCYKNLHNILKRINYTPVDTTLYRAFNFIYGAPSRPTGASVSLSRRGGEM